jgi:FKBP-type peptidyl-prolyl cis-trans isomerase
MDMDTFAMPITIETTPSGLQYSIDHPSTGAQPTAGQTVSVHYTGWLTNGTKFDSSRDRGQPFQFPLGMGRVIRGWDEGVAAMKMGEKRTLVIPPPSATASAARAESSHPTPRSSFRSSSSARSSAPERPSSGCGTFSPPR